VRTNFICVSIKLGSVHRLALGVLLTFAWLVLGLSAHAQLRPAPGAPSNQRPSIRSSSNGTPVVNITKPDKNGVSTNQFDSFNVGKPGLIINNNFLPGHSVLGGVVKHNPNFAWGDFARLIIDQVVGASPSAIDGSVEVFGPRADLLIANPNGITVNGAEFHNVSRLTLSAGSVQYDRHGNVGLSIDTGNLEIGSGGLHVVTIDDVTVLGRNIILDGPVESGYLLSLFAGKRYFDYKSRTSTGTGARGNGKWGIDSSALGGMSAGRIVMESTDQGVGVRAPRHMAASAGDITITANGRIHLGHLRSNGRIIVRSTGASIVQRGNAVATGAIVYQAAGKIKNRGTISSGSDLQLQSTDLVNNGSILSNAAIWIYATGSAENNGKTQGDTGVAAQLGSLRNLGWIISGGIVNKQWGFAALLAGATALVAYGIGDLIPWDKIGGPAVNSDLTQKLEPTYDLNGRLVGNTEVSMTVGELLFKPALEGLAEYGVASALGVKDAEALGIGATAGAYVAPFAINGARDLLGSTGQTASLFSLGNTGYNSYVTSSVSGQITSLVGGIAAAIYDGNYQLGAYGANQVFTYNDSNIARKKNAQSYDLYDIDEKSGYLMHVGTVPDLSFDAPITFDPEILAGGHFYDGMPRNEFTEATLSDGALISVLGTTPSQTVNIFGDGQNNYIPGDFAGSYKEIWTGGLIDYAQSGKAASSPAQFGDPGTPFTVYPSDSSIRSFDAGSATSSADS
jgi:filamentous hemagglutinin family protein